MADYFIRTVVQPSIPNACMTALERWLLEQMFEFEGDNDDSTYFFASENINDQADATNDELAAILREDASPLATTVHDLVVNAPDPDWLDLDALGYVAVFQAIITRHPNEVPYVTLERAYTCSKMRPDGFGGGAELITADDVRWVSTRHWLERQIETLVGGKPGDADARL